MRNVVVTTAVLAGLGVECVDYQSYREPPP
jgi:hypothetical protein